MSTEGKREGSDKLQSCIFCSKSHNSSDCYAAKRMTDEDKRVVLQKGQYCYVCLKKGHSSRNCKSNVSCLLCDKRHFAIMCPKLKTSREVKEVVSEAETIRGEPKERKDSSKEYDVVDVKTMLMAKTPKAEVFLMTLACFIRNGNRELLLRCLIDSGAQHSYLSRSVANRLQLKLIKTVNIVHSLFGGTHTAPGCHQVYRLPLISLDRDFKCNIEVLGQDVICGEISPLTSDEVRVLMDIDEIALAHREDVPNDIELLLGADVFGRLLTGKIKETHNGLVALHTSLGWTLTGRSTYEESHENVLIVTNLHVKESQMSDLWSLEVIGIQDPIEKASKRTVQINILQQFCETIRISKEGRYQVNLPFRENHTILPSYREMTWKRHQAMILRLKRNNLLNDYLDIFAEWERNNIIEKVPT